MVQIAPFRFRPWLVGGLALALLAGAEPAAAQCRVLSAPAAFDPPAGVTPPPNFSSRAGSMTIFDGSGSKRLAVRWNYGFAVYSLAVPAAPRLEYFQNLRDSGYPKNGDGSDRTGSVGASEDGQRFLVPWTDPAGYGTIAMEPSAGKFAATGDFLPNVGLGQDSQVAVLKVDGRYFGFSLVGGAVNVADLTVLPTTNSLVPGSIRSETVQGISVLNGMVLGLVAFQGGGRSWLVVNGYDKIYVGEIKNNGASVPGLAAGFVWRTLTLADFTPLGAATWSSFRNVAAAVHPTEDVPYIMAEGKGAVSPGVTLVKLDPDVTRVGSYIPPAPYNIQTTASTLIPFDTEVLALFLTRSSADTTKLTALASSDFARDLSPEAALGLVSGTALLQALRGTGSSVAIYSGAQTGAWASGLECVLSNAPATPSLLVEKLPSGGGIGVALKSGDPVFLGDTVRITPRVSPPATAQPLDDWRFDYDFHQGSAGEESPEYPRILQPDLCLTCPGGTSTPPVSLDLVGPCDPRNTDPAAPDLLTGSGCWTSVTTNDLQGGPDFASASPSSKLLTFGLEAKNALNVFPQATSGVATFSLLWQVPQPRVKLSSILYGDSVEDGSDGAPDTTSAAWEWYFAPTAGATNLVRDPGCTTGPTCAHAFPGKGSFGYFLKVPYRGGFSTPDCSKDGNGDCTNTLGTIVVSDVSLALTAPPSVYRTQASIAVASQSRKSTSVTGSFSYETCLSPCTATPTSGAAGLVGDPFAGGSVTVPMPPVAGLYDLRLTYTYTGPTECAGAPCKVYWPSETGWAQVLVSNAMPEIRFKSATGADLCFSNFCAIYAGDTGKAYSYVNGVLDPAPPATMRWTWGNGGSSAIGALAQGASFVYSAAGNYVVTLQGYGSDFTREIYVSDKPVEPPPPPPSSGPSVYGLSFSPQNPDAGQIATFTCSASAGSNPIARYRFTWNDGTPATEGASSSATHAFATTGTKTIFCRVFDTAGLYSDRSASITVGSPTGSCDFQIKDDKGIRISFDPVSGSYDAAAGKPLTFDAVGFTGTPSWNFGDGTYGTGDLATHTYTSASPQNGYVVTLTATACSKSYTIYVSGASLDFSVADADTGTFLASPAGALEARAGQPLKFTAAGATGAVSWDFGDGQFSAETSPVKTYAPLVDTTYRVILTSNGQNVEKSLVVKGSTGAALTGNFTFRYADGTAVNRSAVQPNKAITFTGADQATTYTWDFGDGSSLQLGSPREYAFIRGGTFTVKLTVARNEVPGTVTTPSPLAFTVLAPPDPLLWVAAGMAYVDGGNGERWQSDLSIYNPGSQTATISLGFVAGASWDGASNVDWITEAIPAGQTRAFANVLESLFRLDKGVWGVVLVRGDTIPVTPVIVSRTYNAAGVGTVGTFGLSVPALSVAGGVKPQSTAGANFLAGLRHDGSFRTNLTVANLKDEAAEVEFVFRGPDGAVLGSPARIVVEGRGVKQLDKALSSAPPTGEGKAGGAGWTAPTSEFSAEVRITKGAGVYPFATVIDQGTGDSIVVAPSPRPASTYRLPGILRFGQWTSDVSLLNPSAKERRVRLEYSYVKKGEADRTTKSKTVTLKAFEMKVWVDFFKSILELGPDDASEYSNSFIDVAPAFDDAYPTEPLVLNGKTYTASGRGTVGLQVDPYVFEDGIGAQAQGRQILFSGLEANPQFRTNVALFLTPGATASDSAEVDVHVLDSRGRELRSLWVQLNADTPWKQIPGADLFAGLTTTETERATIVVKNPRGTARVGGYATVIDNTSGDATFIAGQPVP